MKFELLSVAIFVISAFTDSQILKEERSNVPLSKNAGTEEAKQNQKVREEQREYSSYQCTGKDNPDYLCRSIGCPTKDNLSVRSCLFKKVCLDHRSQEWLFYHDGEASELPFDTLVDSNSRLKLHPTIFPPDFFVSYVSDYGAGDDLTRYRFRVKEVLGKVPLPTSPASTSASKSASTTTTHSSKNLNDTTPNKIVQHLHNPFLIFARTVSDDNLGHLMFDTYFPLLSLVDTWIGLQNHHIVNKLVALDYRNATDVWKPFNEAYKRFTSDIGGVLFPGGLQSYWDFLQTGVETVKSNRDNNDFTGNHNNQSSHSKTQETSSSSPLPNLLTCFDQLLVGSGTQDSSGQKGGAFLRHRPYRYMKYALLQAYAPHTLAGPHSSIRSTPVPPTTTSAKSSSSSSSPPLSFFHPMCPTHSSSRAHSTNPTAILLFFPYLNLVPF